MLFVRRTAGDADHQTDSNIGETVQHIPCNPSSSGLAIFAVWQDGDNDVVSPNSSQGIVVIVVGRHTFRWFVLFIEEGLGGNVFCTEGGDPANCVIFWIRHCCFSFL